MNGLGFELNNISLFRSCFDAISRIVDEAQIRIDYTGLKITSIDKSKITFLNLEFDNTLDTDYKACFNALKINDTLYADKFKTDVFVKMGDDLPITLNFETDTKDVRLSFILAPRIEAEE